MENNVTKKSWPPYLILGLISLIAALILALTNAITAGPIAEHKMAALQETFSAVMPAASYEEVSFSSSAYSNVSSIYAAKDENGNIIGYCVTASQQGYAGPVAVTFGMDPAGSVVATKVGDTDFQETTGIGAKALNPEFAEQFTGLNAAEGGSFEAISGATFTSKAILGDANGAFGAMADAVLGKAGGEVVFGKREAAAAAPVDASALTPGATLKGEAQGFGGKVTVTVTLDDNTNIGSLAVDAPDETEGLGKLAQESAFTDQFAGKSIPVALEDISAVSGATITTTAVVEAINSAAPAAAEILPGATLEGSAQGFAGPVSVKVKLDDSLQIESLSVKAPDETEGLGKMAEESSFTDQFAGKSIPVALEDISAVSGATITTTAVVNAINSAVPVEAEGALTVDELSSITEGSVGLQSNGLAVVSADSNYSGTLVGEFQYENGQLVNASIATPAPAVEEPVAEPAAEAADVLTATKPGYDNLDVTVSLTKAADGTVGSLTVDASTQTPGLGQRCAEEAFTSQFVGKTAPFVLGENVDAVASATLTSTAVVDAVNELMAGAPAAEEPAAEPAAEEPAAEAAETLTATKPGYDNLDVTVSLTKAADGTVASLTVDASTQTPGLGQRCAEEDFTSQFVGKTAPFVLGENVDAVASATLTSTAVVDAVNELMAGAPAAEEPAAEPAAEEPAVEEPAPEVTAVPADLGEVYSITKPGFGELPLTVSLTKSDDGTVTSLTVDASIQTAGIGDRVADTAFTSQFIGKTGPFVLGENVDAMAGATISSAAVVDAVNELLAAPAGEAVVQETPVPEDLGEVYTITKPGFGELPVTVSLTKSDDGTVTSLTVDASVQTAGIGDRVADTAFTSQFVGKTGPFAIGENIDALAGATLTSSAVVEAVNELLGLLPEATEAPTPEPTAEPTPVPTAAPTAEPTQEPTAAPDPTEAPTATPAPTEAPIVPEVGEDGTLTATVPGFGGLPLVVSLKKAEDGTVAALTIDASAQTAGIGDRCSDEAFTGQFVGKTAPFAIGENIDAVAGATVTSTAIVKAVNALMDYTSGN